jgi:hypothetical protein
MSISAPILRHLAFEDLATFAPVPESEGYQLAPPCMAAEAAEEHGPAPMVAGQAMLREWAGELPA